MAEMKHSSVGASSCERWWNCPASIRMSEGLPRESGAAAAAGTVAHGLAEEMLAGKLGRSKFSSRIGKIVEQDGFSVEITEKMLDGVDLYASTVWEDHRQIWADMTKSAELPKHYKYLSVEKSFNLSEIDPEAYGTNDANIAVPFGKLIVYDFKSGYAEVFPEENKQLMYYALGEYMLDQNYSEIELVIVQPASYPAVKRWSLSPETLEKFAEELSIRIKRTRDPAALPNVGAWCKYCEARKARVCPAQEKFISSTLDIDFSDSNTLPVTLERLPKVSSEKLGELLEALPVIESWIEAVRAQGCKILKSGGEVPGYKLVESFGNRRYTDAKVVEDVYGLEFGDDIYSKPKLKTPAQLEKLLGSKRKHELQSYTERPIKEPIMVPCADKRTEAKSSLEADFGIL
jgi:hypothetical protein